MGAARSGRLCGMTRTFRRAASAALASTALIGLAAAVPQQAAAQPAPLPTFDFADCPELPAGADPAQWRCEVLLSSGTIKFGALGVQDTGAMRLTFAEG